VVDSIDTEQEDPFATQMTPASWHRRTQISDNKANKQNTYSAVVFANRHKNVCFDRKTKIREKVDPYKGAWTKFSMLTFCTIPVMI
tara:strand:- start:3675 stop:3932 length:258 start_codon:yes stop_codon:yes gene_type:complete